MSTGSVSKYYRTMGPQFLMNELGSVAAAMARNRAFLGNVPEGTPTREQLLEVRDRLGHAQEAALTHDTNMIRARNAIQAEAVALLDKVAKYLEFVAVGDPNVLIDSGFTPRPPTKKEYLLPAPQGLSVYQGPQQGVYIAKVNHLNSAHSWEIHVAESDPSVEQNWRIHSVHVNSESMILTGLNPANLPYLRIRGLNRAGAGAWSPPVPLPTK